MEPIKITKENFEQEVLQADKPILMDFWASWCGPCKMLSPIVEEIAQKHAEIKVCKVNVDEEEELSSLFKIRNIPALFVLKEGKVTNQTVGYHSAEEILKLL